VNNSYTLSTVADQIVFWLQQKGIDKVFVYPGGTIAPLINSCVQLGVKVEVFKHEQGAAYAAIAYGRVTGKTQIVMVTSGPGVTNVITPLADAYYDSTPLLLITGQVGTSDLCSGRNVRQRGFQETPTTSIVKNISKAVACPLNAEDALKNLAELFAISKKGRQGPTVLDLPVDVQRSKCTTQFPELKSNPVPRNEISNKNYEEIAKALSQARRPVILLGHGALEAGAFETYQDLAEKSKAFVVCSLLGLGSFSNESERFLGYIGHTGHLVANEAVHQADFLLALGTRLDLRQTGTMTDSFVPSGKVAWINNDPDEIAFPRIKTHWALVGEAGLFATEVLKKINSVAEKDEIWFNNLKIKREKSLEDIYEESNSISPKEVLLKIKELMQTSKGTVVTGVGSHQQWAARHLSFGPNSWKLLTSGGHGAMGYDLPSAIGASLASPSEPVLCVVGDGSLLMNIQELASLAERKLFVKILVLNNSRLGIVSQFQKITWGQDPTTGDFNSVDFEYIAKGFGISADTVENKDELDRKLEKFWKTKGPNLLNVKIDHATEVVPMLLAGQMMDEMWQGHK
jgi:acetolactate synthase-1/2/3 large subunit